LPAARARGRLSGLPRGLDSACFLFAPQICAQRRSVTVIVAPDFGGEAKFITPPAGPRHACQVRIANRR
jgi:hypothetical protein